MSRLGPKPFPIPDKVQVKKEGSSVVVSGSLGTLKRDLPEGLTIEIGEKEIQILAENNSSKLSALHGLWRKLVQNMVEGVSTGFMKTLEIVGVGYRASVSGQVISFQLGLSHPVNFPVPEGISATVDKQVVINLKGVNKELIGETAARIRSLRPPEPYKGTGIRLKGEHILRKTGKSAAMGAGGGAKK